MNESKENKESYTATYFKFKCQVIRMVIGVQSVCLQADDHNLWKSTKLAGVSLNLTFENKSSYFHIAHLFFGTGNQGCFAL